MHDVIIIGSGYGGCIAAKALSARGADVLVLERGAVVPHTEDAYSLGAQLTRLARLRNYSVSAVGGGSAINYGVFVPPSEEDVRTSFGAGFLREREPFLRLIREWGEEGAASGGAVYLASKIKEKLGISFKTTSEASADYRDVVLRPKTIQQEVRQDAAFFLQSEEWEEEPVPIRACTRVESVEMVEEETQTTWRVHLGGGKPPLMARRVLICAGPIETPALLLRSERKGHLKGRRLHPEIGKNMQDHARMQVIGCVPVGRFARDGGARHAKIEVVYNTSDTKDSTGQRYDVHAEQVFHTGLDAVSVSAVACLPFPASFGLNCIPNACVCEEGFGSSLFEVAALVPLGLQKMLNPLAWCSAYDFVMGGVTQPNGSVTLLGDGSTKVDLPTPSEEQKEAIRAKADLVREALGEAGVSLTYKSCGFDTQWHYTGTASVLSGCLTGRMEVNDASGRPIEGLYCGDASSASKPSQFNTGPLAAFAGYVAGSRMKLPERKGPNPSATMRRE